MPLEAGRAAGAAAEGAVGARRPLHATIGTSGSVHALGKAYRDVVRGFRGEFENPPDLVALPRDESEIEAVLSWAEARGRRGDPLRRRHQRRRRGRARGLGERPFVSLDLRRLDRVLEVDATSLAARIQAGATGPGLEEQLREHGLTLRHFPQSFEYSTLGGWVATRAGGHFATLYTHIDDLVESVRAITPRGTWESRRLPGSGAGPSPDRALIGSEGILGVIAEAWVRVRPRPRVQALLRRSSSTTSSPPPGRCGRSPSRASTRPTAACSTRSRRGPPAPAAASSTCSCSASSPPTTRSSDPMEIAARDRQEHGGPAGPRRRCRGARRRRARRRGRRLARRVPHGSLPARHLRRLRGPLRDLRVGDHLGPLRGLPRGGDGGGARRRSPRSATRPPRGPGRRGSAAASPTSTRTARRPTSRSSPRPSAAARSSSGTRSRPPPRRR